MPGTSIFEFTSRLFSESHFHQSMKAYHDKFGPAYTRWFAHRMSVNVATPELAKQIFLDTKTFPKLGVILNFHTRRFIGGNKNVLLSNGSLWKKQREVIDPAFYNMQNFVDTFVEKSYQVMDLLKRQNQVSDILDITQKMALDVLGKTIFGHDFHALHGSIQKDLQACRDVVEGLGKTFYNIFFPLTYLPFLKYNTVMKSGIDELERLYNQLIEVSRKKLQSGKPATAMLDFMVSASEDGITAQELRNNVSVFFVAGHETTATALAYAIYALAQHQDVQEKARKEVQEVLGDKPPTYEQLQKLDYLNMVIKEVLRMYPPVAFIPGKYAAKDTVIAGYKVPKGTMVSISVYSIHYSKDVYENPYEFRPERWAKKIDKGAFAWIPFGAGPRVCIGKNFSLLEQKVFLAILLQNFKFSLRDNKPIVMKRVVLTRPEKMDLVFTKL